LAQHAIAGTAMRNVASVTQRGRQGDHRKVEWNAGILLGGQLYADMKKKTEAFSVLPFN